MNYNSRIKLRDPKEFRKNDPLPLAQVGGRVDRVVKYYKGYHGIVSKASARRWLNK